MCVFPRVGRKSGMLFPGRRAGQQERGTVGTEAPLPEPQPRAELELHLGETHALNSSTPPAFPLLAEKGAKFRAEKIKKNLKN